jgi:NAD(P)-dependent dehydrogenase (short-subunit alcohol dehydrogenase family)
MRMQNKMGLVTGAASGLGEESAKLLAAEGAAVLVCDIDIANGERVAREIVAAGGTAKFQKCDVRVEQDIIDAISEVRREWGGFNFMHNNAGVQLEKPIHETTNEDWDWINEVNLRGTFWCCKHGVNAMREIGGGGSIVNTASALALVSDPFLPVYTATKHGVLGLTRSVGLAYAIDGIRCNCVCPGDMETPMIVKYWNATGDPEKAKAEMAAQYPAKKIGHPREVAQMVLFLASDESSYVNATYMIVDGGLLAKVY